MGETPISDYQVIPASQDIENRKQLLILIVFIIIKLEIICLIFQKILNKDLLLKII